MSALPIEIEQSDAMLARLAALDLRAAEHVNACLLDTTDPTGVADLARAYARLSRSLRQTLALLARLKADRAKAAREAAQPRTYPWEETDPADERADALQHAVDRVISAAADGDRQRHTDWVHRFDREMDDWTEAPDFLLEDLGAQVLRACRALGLPDHLATRWRDLPDPTFLPDPEPETPEQIAAATAAAREALAGFRAAASGRRPTDPGAPRVPWKNSG